MINRNGRELNIADGIREFAIASPRATAIIDGDRSVTYAELDSRSSRVANLLLRSGLNIGSHVALYCGNRLEYAEVAAGIAKAGMVLIPLNPRSTLPELTYILSHSDSAALIVDEALGAVGVAAAENAGIAKVWAFDAVDAGPSYEAEMQASPASDPEIRPDENSSFAICYTSGTTGKPKGVMLSHRSRSLTFMAAAVDWKLGPGKNTVAVAPMYHGAGFAFAYAGWAVGGTVSMLRSFDAERVLAMVEQDRVSSMFLVPAHASMIRDLGDDMIRSFDLSSLECLYFNAAPFPTPLKKWTMETFSATGIHECYGSTEAGVVTNLRPEFQLSKPGSVGHAWFHTEVRLLDDQGNNVPVGEPGELFSRSPYLMTGYYKAETEVDATTTPDGFLSAGDVAVSDEDGFIYIVDRVKDMIISGGVNVFPREIEEVLAKHPGVRDVAVVGASDEKWGERVVAVVVGEATDEDLEKLAREELSGYKIPRQYVRVDELPRNAAGKILKRELRDGLASDEA